MNLNDLPTPTLILDRERVRANTDEMRARIHAHGVALRPHAKTAKSVDVARMAVGDNGNALAVSTLREADLSEADFSKANLSRTDLRESNLQNADLREADLRAADLREAILVAAYLNEANLDGADMRKANLYRASMRGATLCNTIDPEGGKNNKDC